MSTVPLAFGVAAWFAAILARDLAHPGDERTPRPDFERVELPDRLVTLAQVHGLR